jgi:sulfide dehydrogenase cytochrome subunit
MADRPSLHHSVMKANAILIATLVTAAPAAAQSVTPPGAAACSGCHAPAGTAVPPIRGRSPDEIVSAMRAFRTGERQATVMDRIAKGFSDEETRAIATWLAAQR